MANEITMAEVIRRIEASWQEFQTFLKQYTDEQLSMLVDEAGWRVQDHLMHIVDWENGISALLHKQSRAAGMGLDKKTFEEGPLDTINDRMYENGKALSLAEVKQKLQDAYQRLVDTLRALNDEDLKRSYSYFQPDESGPDDGRPIVDRILDNSAGHYEEHRPWIEALVRRNTRAKPQ